MNRSQLILLSALFLLGASTALVADRAGQDPNPGQRYVDMQRCFDGYQGAQKEVARLNELYKGKVEEFRQREQRIHEMEGDLAVLEQGSDAWAEKKLAYEKEKADLDREKQFQAERLKKSQLELFWRTYQAVQRVSGQIGQENGFGAILVVPLPVDGLPADLPTAVETLQGRSVLWTNPNYDITDQVLAALNAEQ